MVRRNFLSALQALVENRQRAVLSALGIMVASVAILLLVSIARGVQADLRNQIEDLGVNVLIVLPGKIKDGSAFNPNIAGLSYLQERDVEGVKSVPGVKTAAPIMFCGGGITFGKKESMSTLTLATDSNWFKVHPTTVVEGRLFEPIDDGQDVCIIGTIAKEELFGKETAVGKTVDINQRKCKVIGVVSEKSGEDSIFSQFSFANIAYLPFSLVKKTSPQIQIHRIMIQTDPEAEPKKLKAAVTSKLEEHLDERMFSVLTQDDLLKMVFKIMGILTWLLSGLTSIALFVGGVGIMTVMLMSVGERTKEIGLRKAMGANQRDILVQFLCESTILALAGGAVGLVFSWTVDQLLLRFTPIKPDLSLSVVMLGLVVCLFVGVIFGLWPAIRAAQKDPVESLRAE